MELTHLFSPGKIGSVKIKNKIVRSATYVARADESGYVTEDLINFYQTLSEGGVGLIISGNISVHEKGAATIRMTRLYNDTYIPGQKKLVDAIHDTSDTKVAAQLTHTGSNIVIKALIRDGYELIGPSAINVPGSTQLVRELPVNEIHDIINSFIKSGIYAYECGYDMIQLHGAHGFLLSDFLSPFTNKRNDEYGGTLEKRFRILEDIYHGLRDGLGKNYPLMIKLNTHDNLRNGLTLEEGMEYAKKLVALGIDAIEPSSGRNNPRFTNDRTFPAVYIRDPKEENYFGHIAKKLKPVMGICPLIFMGGVRNPLKAEELLKERLVDFISMSRPFIYEPDLVKRWQNGNYDSAYCTSCNTCLGTAIQGGVYCPIKK